MIDCQGSAVGSHRGFYLYSGETRAIVSGLTIMNGYVAPNEADIGNGGGICIDGSSVTVRNCLLTGNTVSQADRGCPCPSIDTRRGNPV